MLPQGGESAVIDGVVEARKPDVVLDAEGLSDGDERAGDVSNCGALCLVRVRPGERRERSRRCIAGGFRASSTAIVPTPCGSSSKGLQTRSRPRRRTRWSRCSASIRVAPHHRKPLPGGRAGYEPGSWRGRVEEFAHRPGELPPLLTFPLLLVTRPAWASLGLERCRARVGTASRLRGASRRSR